MPHNYTHQEYPKQVYHPETAEMIVANGEHEVPEGWVDYHPKDPQHAHKAFAMPTEPGEDDKPPTISRAAVIAELDRREIKYSKRASTADLVELLNS